MGVTHCDGATRRLRLKVMGDRGSFVPRLFERIFNNALQAMEEGGILTVSTRKGEPGRTGLRCRWWPEPKTPVPGFEHRGPGQAI